jgi:hypothetical protein
VEFTSQYPPDVDLLGRVDYPLRWAGRPSF